MEERKIRGWTYNKKNHKKERNNCKTEIIGNINNHKCFFQKLNFKKPSEKYIIGDFETITNNDLKQEVNYAILTYFPKKDKNNKYIKSEKFDFYNIEDCYRWLLNPRHKGYTVIFHNGGNFDYNILQYCKNKIFLILYIYHFRPSQGNM